MASNSNTTDTTYQSDVEHVENLYNSINSLEAKFKQIIATKKGDEKIDTDDKMMKLQTQFWEDHVTCIDSCNQEYMKNHEKGSEGMYKKCCDLSQKFCCLVNMYKKIIFGDWPATDLESRKRTIFIAICDIDRFRCAKTVSNCVMSVKNG